MPERLRQYLTRCNTMRRPVGLSLVCIAALCTGCLPLPLRYYVPSQEGAKAVTLSCAGGPLRGASSFGVAPRYHLLVSLSGSSLVVIINADPLATIEFDPSLIRVEAGGDPVPIEVMRYRMTIDGSEKARVVSGPLKVGTGKLQVSVLLKLSGAPQVTAHLPPIAVNGAVTQFPDISFKLEWHTHLTMIIGNC
jgi:hypothetical protein